MSVVKRSIVVLVVYFLCCLSPLSCVFAQDRYCGIYAVYQASVILGDEPKEFDRLIDEKFVSTIGGSTSDDLILASKEVGLSATEHRGLAFDSLLQARHPLILHVMSEGQVDTYNHWLLFVGMSDRNNALVVDKPGKPSVVPISLLLSRWDGIAIELRLAGDSGGQQFLFGKGILWCCFLLVCTASVFAAGKIRVPGRYPSLLRLALAFLIALPATCMIAPTNGPTHYLEAAITRGTFPDIEYSEVKTLSESGSESSGRFLLIDAREFREFGAGTIPGSLNVPYGIDRDAIEEILNGYPKNTRLILFCGSRRCVFANFLGVRLTSLGYSNIEVFRGGMEEWTYKTR